MSKKKEEKKNGSCSSFILAIMLVALATKIFSCGNAENDDEEYAEQTQEEVEVLSAPPVMPEPEPEPVPEEPPVPAAPQFISVTRELVDIPDEPEEVLVEETVEEETDAIVESEISNL